MPSFEPIYNGAVANGDVLTARKGRGLTPALWRGIDLSVKDPSQGLAYVTDFLDCPVLTLTNKTAGTANYSTTLGNGVLSVAAASTTDDQGSNVQFAGCSVIPTDWQIVAFETYVRFDAIGSGNTTSGHNTVLGLCNYDTSVLASGAIDTSGNGITDYGLWVSISSATTWNAANKLSFRQTRDNSTVTAEADIHTLVDGSSTATAWVKLGVRYEPGRAIELYLNGVKIDSSDLTLASIPNAPVMPTFVTESEGTVSPVLQVDWFALGAA